MKPTNFQKQTSRYEAKVMSAHVIKKQNGKCDICRSFLPWILELHHVIPVAKGGIGLDSNIVALCPNCHAIVEKCKTKTINDPRFHDWIRDTYGDDAYKKIEGFWTEKL